MWTVRAEALGLVGGGEATGTWEKEASAGGGDGGTQSWRGARPQAQWVLAMGLRVRPGPPPEALQEEPSWRGVWSQDFWFSRDCFNQRVVLAIVSK